MACCRRRPLAGSCAAAVVFSTEAVYVSGNAVPFVLLKLARSPATFSFPKGMETVASERLLRGPAGSVSEGGSWMSGLVLLRVSMYGQG